MSEKLKDDFYRAVNEEWLKNATIPEDKPATGGFVEISDDIEELLTSKTKLWSEGKEEIPKEYPILKEFVNFYKQATDFKKREELGNKPALKYIKRIEDLKSFDDLKENYVDLLFDNYTLPLEFEIMQDFKDSSKQILAMDIGSLILPEKTYYADEKNKTQLLDAYRKTAKAILLKLDKSEKEADVLIENTIKFDALLVPIKRTAVERADYTTLYNIYQTKEIKKHFSNLDVKKIADQLVDNDVSSINILNNNILKNLSDLINENNFKLIQSWMIVKMIFHLAGYLTDELRILSSQFGRILSGIKEPKEKYKEAYQLSYSEFNMAIGKYYGEVHFGSKARSDVKKIVKSIIDNYKKRLEKNPWLSKETIKKAITKLNKLVAHIGYPDKIEKEYSLLKTKDYKSGGNLLDNAYEFDKIFLKAHFKKYLKPIDKQIWGMAASTVNAYFHPFFNIIVFPAAILQKPFYSIDQTPSENYGGIGAVIAHEISHAFDNNGARFDENGNFNNWWKEKDYKKFKELSKDVIDQFEGLDTEFGKCNGTLTVSENIADLGGIHCSFEACKKTKSFNAKEFFTNWARVWRFKPSKNYAVMLLKADVHAPAELRANVQLKNVDEFFETFDIKEKDKMFLPKDKRVKIW